MEFVSEWRYMHLYNYILLVIYHIFGGIRPSVFHTLPVIIYNLVFKEYIGWKPKQSMKDRDDEQKDPSASQAHLMNLYHMKYCKCWNFRVGVIFAFFALLSFSRKLPPRENKTNKPLWRKNE